VLPLGACFHETFVHKGKRIFFQGVLKAGRIYGSRKYDRFDGNKNFFDVVSICGTSDVRINSFFGIFIECDKLILYEFRSLIELLGAIIIWKSLRNIYFFDFLIIGNSSSADATCSTTSFSLSSVFSFFATFGRSCRFFFFMG